MTRSKCGQYPLFIYPRHMFKSYRLYLLNHFGKGGGHYGFWFFFKFCVLRRYVFWIFTPSCLKTCIIKPQPLFTRIPSQFKSLPKTERFVFPDNINILYLCQRLFQLFTKLYFPTTVNACEMHHPKKIRARN